MSTKTNQTTEDRSSLHALFGELEAAHQQLRALAKKVRRTKCMSEWGFVDDAADAVEEAAKRSRASSPNAEVRHGASDADLD